MRSRANDRGRPQTTVEHCDSQSLRHVRLPTLTIRILNRRENGDGASQPPAKVTKTRRRIGSGATDKSAHGYASCPPMRANEIAIS